MKTFIYQAKESKSKNLVNYFLLFILLLFSISGVAQVRKAFTPRTSVEAGNKTIYNLKGDFTMLGNLSLRLQTYGDNTTNGGNMMVYADVDTDPSTVNSSSASLVLSTENGSDPNCSEIVFAGLYWSGRVSGGNTTSVTTSQPVTNNLTNQNATWSHNSVTYTNAALSIARLGGNNDRYPEYTFVVGTETHVIRINNNSASGNTLRGTVSINGGSFQSLPGSYNSSTGIFTPTGTYTITSGGTSVTINSIRRNISASGSTGDYQTSPTNSASVTLNGTFITTQNVTTTLDKTKVKIKGPGAPTYTDLTANASDIQYPGDNNMYAAYKDVTSYVKQYGIGSYTVANVSSTEGEGDGVGYYGGWGMVVVYGNSKMKWRDITVFDGYAYVVNGVATHELPISGFHATQAGDVKVKLGVMAGEGDRNYDGDFLNIRNAANTAWVPLQHVGNPPSGGTPNFFNSSVQTGGNARNPNLLNNSGLDIAMFEIPNATKQIIQNNATSTTLQYGSTLDTYIIYNIVFGVDAYVPEVEPLNTIVSVNGSPSSGTPTVQPGDIIEYKLQIKNRGTEGVSNAKVTIPVPYTASFVSGSLVGTPGPGVTPAAAPAFDPLNGALGSIVWNIGSLPLPANPETVLATLTYKFKVTEDCFLLANPNCTPTVAVDGLVTGVGAVTGTTLGGSGEFISGFQSEGACQGEPIRDPIAVQINVGNHCQNYQYQILDFVFCEATSNAVILAQVRSAFPAGTRFYSNANGTGTEYNESTPFPLNDPNLVFYAKPAGAEGCYYEFKIKVTDITDLPTVSSTPIVYCVGETAVPLTATATVAGYNLYYYTAIDGNGKPVGSALNAITPPTSTAGTFTYYVTQGTAICQSDPVAITVQVLATPTITTDLQNVTLCQNTNGSMTVVVGNTLPAFTYTWEMEVGGVWQAINNTALTSNGATLNITNVPLSLNGTKVRVTIANGRCAITSAVGTITVNKLTTVTTSPVGATYCKDAVATALSVVAEGTGTLTYQWYSNTLNSTTGGTLITGATNASYTPVTTTVGTQYYYVVVKGSCGADATSAVAAIIINKPTAVTTSPVGATYCKDAVATALSVVAEGTGTLTYQWYSNTINSTTGGTLITGATNASYTPVTTTVGTQYYYVVVKGSCGADATSAVAAIIINKPTAVTTSPVGATYCKDAVATALSVVAEGTGTLTYQWYSNTINSTTGGTLITGATNASYTPVTTTVGTQYYYVVVKGSCGADATSAVAAIIINKPTAVTTSPVGATYCKDAVATALSVVAEGTGTLTYQWYSNTLNSTTGGTLITGATNATYTPVTTTVGTQYYYVVVKGSCGADATSAVAAIIINKPTAVTTSPVGATYCKDAVATALSVVAEGTGTLSYQWYSNTLNSTTGGTLITGATNATYTPVATTVGTQYYYVVVKGSCGADATSAVAAIIINKPTAVTTSPVGATYCKDAVATALSVVAEGTGTLTYQWYSNTINSTTGGTLITGATNATYTPVTTTVGTQYYYVVVKGSCGADATSAVAAIIINKPTAVTTSPVGATYCKDAVATALSVVAEGTGTLTYQWYSNTLNSTTGGTLITGATNATYTPVTTTVGTQYYYVVVKGSCGADATSAVAAIIINKPTAVTTSPVGATYCKDAVATALSVVAEGTGTLTYQWYSNTLNSTTGGTLITGATNATYTPVTTTVGTQYYYVVVKGSCGADATSAVAAIIINKPTAVTTSPVGATYCKDAVATALSVVAEGTGTLTYQWYSNTLNSTTGGTLITGATNATYTPVTTTVGTQYYYVVVKGSCGADATSAVAAIIINKPTAVTTSPVGATYCKDAVATALSVVAEGTGTLSYQWYSNTINSTTGGTLITGATASSYTPSSATVGTQYYYVVVKGSCGADATSAVAAIIINKPTAVTTSPVGATYCKDAVATALSVVAEGTGTLSYQWYSNTLNSTTGGTLIAGATNATYTPSSATVGTQYYYVVVGSDCGADVTSAVVSIVVNQPTVITTSPEGGIYCQNTEVLPLSVVANGTGELSYQWYSNTINSTTGGTLITGATNATYTPSSTTVGTQYYYVVVGSDCGADVTSAVVSIVVNQPTVITTSPEGGIYCQNTEVLPLSVVANGTGELSYQWYSNTINSTTGGTLITGATASSYTPSSATVGTQYYYVVVGSDCGADVTSAVVSIVVNQPTVITTSPEGGTYCQNTEVLPLSVVANGTGELSYQWYSNTINSTTGGTLITGATASSYTPSSATVGTQYYYVVVGSDCGADVTSAVVSIVVNQPTVITTSPEGGTYCQNTEVLPLSVVANGTGELSYQWYSNTINSTTGGTLITGATASSYTPSSATVGTQYYYVVVGSDCGADVTSAVVSIVVNQPTVITTSPEGGIYCQNTEVLPLSVVANGTGELTYQWYSNTINSTTGGTLITGATNATFTPSSATVGTQYYYVVVGSDCGADVTSAVVSIVVNQPTVITTSPEGGIYCQNTEVLPLSVVANGTGELSYQWYSNTINSTTGGTLITGATNATYTPSSATVGTQYYYVVVGSDCGADVTSAVVSIVVNQPTVITTSPEDATYCKDVAATALSVVAEGTGTLTYQWYSNTINSTTGGTLITGATSATYIPSTAVVGTQYYYVLVHGDCGADVRSAIATITVNKPTTVVSSPVGSTYCEGGGATVLSVVADGTGELTYQWYSNSTNATTGGTLIPGATSDTYLPTTTTVGTRYYYVVVTGECGTISTSSAAAVKVNALPEPPVVETITTFSGGPEIAYDVVALPNHTLTWYTDMNGTSPRSLNASVRTDVIGVFTAYVSQTNNETGCTSRIIPVQIIVKSIGIAVEKEVDQTAVTGPKLLTYKIKVTNTGTYDLTQVNVVDILKQENAPDMSITAIGSPVESGVANGILEAQETWTYQFTYMVDQGRVDNGKNVINTVSVTTHEVEVPVTDAVETSISQSGAIRVVKNHALPSTGERGCYELKVGDKIPYRFAVSNGGNVTLRNITLNDPLVGLTTPILTGGDTNNNGQLDVGEVWNYTAEYTIKQADIDAGRVSNQATVRGSTPAGVQVSDLSGSSVNTDGATIVNICALPSVSIEKIADRAEIVQVGEEVKYTLKVKNTGNTMLYNVVVTDILFSDWSRTLATLAPKEEVVINLTYKVTQADFDKGTVKNIARVEGRDKQEVPVKGASPEVVIPIKYINKLVVEKTADVTQVGELDAEISYTILVRNDGNQPLINVVVVDPLTNLNRTIEKLAPGESTTITTVYKVTVDDLRNKSTIENVVNVTAKTPQGTEVKGTDAVTVKVVPVDNFKIPNVFTPNGDGTNDNFEIIGIELLDRVEVIIINRWGNEVYRNDNYRNDWSGEGLNNGTYYYIIHTIDRGVRTPYKGWVMIKK